MFEPETKNVLSSVAIPVMGCAAVSAYPVSHSKTRDTSRPVHAAHRAARTACLGSPTFRDNSHNAAKRNRFVRQHVAEHRPASIVNGFRHSRFAELGRAHISDVYFCKFTRDRRGRDVKKMSALIRNLRVQRSYSLLLLSPLGKRKLSLGLAIERRHLDCASIGQRGQRLESEINPNRSANPLRQRGNFNLNVDVPTATGIGTDIETLGLGTSWNTPRQPQMIVPLAESENGAVELSRSRKIGKRYPVKISLMAPKSRRFGEAGIAAIGELSANCINGVRVDTKFGGHSTAEIGKVEGARASDLHSRSIPRLSLSVDFAEIVPDEINGASLPPKGAFGRGTSVLDPVSVCEDNSFSRRHVYTRCWMVRGFKRINAYCPAFIVNYPQQVKESALLPGLKTGVSARRVG
jgi:hypothetical protein